MYKIVDLEGNAMYYFDTELEAEKFIHDMNIVDGYIILKDNSEKKINK